MGAGDGTQDVDVGDAGPSFAVGQAPEPGGDVWGPAAEAAGDAAGPDRRRPAGLTAGGGPPHRGARGRGSPPQGEVRRIVR
jgi:hypothetical protein